ncbi:MAG: L-lactate dehydrogenase [Elusimicrobia bacterium]|nr:L-lactate dehydrogenase [Elusimicrobiota bacterium]
MLKPKVAVIGCGNVGMRYAHSLMIGGAARSIVLVDVDVERAEGEVLDLSSGMPYIVSPVEVSSGTYADIAGSDLVVITAGRKQSPGQTRMALAKDNVDLFRRIVPEIVKHAPDAVLLVVSNPVDVLSYAAYKFSGRPSGKVIGSGTVLDSGRLRWLLSCHCGVDARNIHAYMLGEHGDSEFPVWSRAMIGGILLDEYCPVCGKCDRGDLLEKISEEVRTFAYKVIERKGETSYGIGLALVRITQAVLHDQNSVLPVGCLVADYYGINDVYMSLPALVNRSGLRQILRPRLNDVEIGLLKKSAAEIRNVLDECGL